MEGPCIREAHGVHGQGGVQNSAPGHCRLHLPRGDRAVLKHMFPGIGLWSYPPICSDSQPECSFSLAAGGHVAPHPALLTLHTKNTSIICLCSSLSWLWALRLLCAVGRNVCSYTHAVILSGSVFDVIFRFVSGVFSESLSDICCHMEVIHPVPKAKCSSAPTQGPHTLRNSYLGPWDRCRQSQSALGDVQVLTEAQTQPCGREDSKTTSCRDISPKSTLGASVGAGEGSH